MKVSLSRLVTICVFVAFCHNDVLLAVFLNEQPTDTGKSTSIYEDSQLYSISSQIKDLIQGLIWQNVLTIRASASKPRKVDPALFAPPLGDFDRIARILAGLYIDRTLNDPASRLHARRMDKAWKGLNLEKISEWALINITPHLGGSNTLFYPFGGPDALYPVKLFPQMKNYVLVGLEPIGNFEDIRKNIENNAALNAIKIAFSHYLEKGYFITSQMMTQLSNQSIRGALYLILIELVRNGHAIVSIENKSIDADGNEVARQKGMIDCVKIVFQLVGSGEQKNMYYVRANLANENKKLSYLKNFMRNFAFITFIKSASYVLHDQGASQIATFILMHSGAILQDDTGLRFARFSPEWKMYPFGKYVGPNLAFFNSYRQNDLIEFFAKNHPKPLPFTIGYGFSKKRPNLLLAVSPLEYLRVMQARDSRSSEADDIGDCPCKRKRPQVTT
ncbi:MAG: hypothetical protein LBS14_01545 [Holosporaceae bacterium]|jgi:hypothetical protein|nr:hypothetical protein [Holosporaceae bacterium]